MLEWLVAAVIRAAFLDELRHSGTFFDPARRSSCEASILGRPIKGQADAWQTQEFWRVSGSRLTLRRPATRLSSVELQPWGREGYDKSADPLNRTPRGILPMLRPSISRCLQHSVREPHWFRRCAWLASVVGILWLFGSVIRAGETQQMLPRRPIEPAVLVRDGQPAASVVCPADPRYLELGRRIASSVRQLTGAQLPVLVDTQVVPQDRGSPSDAYQRQTLVLLGSLNTNRAVLPLYAKFYVACDRQYPGGDGYLLQTVRDPYGVGAHQILLGGSSRAGVERAVAAFLSTLSKGEQRHTLAVPRLLTIVPGGEFKAPFDAAVARARASARPSADFCVDAMNYQWTGEPQLLRRAAECVRRLDFNHPQGGPWSDYELEAAVRGFNALDDAGALSPEELQAVDNLLLRYAQAHANAYWRSRQPSDFGQRHQTMGTMAFHTLVKYLLLRGNPNAEARAQLLRWRDECRAFLHAFAGTYRDDNDDNGSFHSAEPLLRYVMEDRDFEFFRSGMARKVASRAIFVTDNRGWGAGIGNYEECRPGYVMYPNSTGSAIGLAAFYYGDGGYRWLLDNAPGVHRPGGGWAFSPGIAGGRYPLSDQVSSQEPKSLLGVRALMLDQYHYRRSGYYMAHGPFPAPAERPGMPKCPRPAQ